MKKALLLIFSAILVLGCIYALFNNIYITSSSKTFKVNNLNIEIITKDCMTCIWLDPDVKKIIKISDQKTIKKFKLEAPTQITKTRIVFGKAKPGSKFHDKGIISVIIFPNELEKLESFNYKTGEDLNKIEDGRFIWDNYYSDNSVKDVIKDLDVEFDVTLN